MPNLVLYMMHTCGFCRKVLDFMEQEGIKIETKNTLESSEIRDELVAIAGKSQVPCLVIDGKPLHESDDIIQWLKDNWKKDE